MRLFTARSSRVAPLLRPGFLPPSPRSPVACRNACACFTPGAHLLQPPLQANNSHHAPVSRNQGLTLLYPVYSPHPPCTFTRFAAQQPSELQAIPANRLVQLLQASNSHHALCSRIDLLPLFSCPLIPLSQLSSRPRCRPYRRNDWCSCPCVKSKAATMLATNSPTLCTASFPPSLPPCSSAAF